MIKKLLLIATIVLFSITSYETQAKSGCCSYHGGVCGSSCCDGSSLSRNCGSYNIYELSCDNLSKYDKNYTSYINNIKDIISKMQDEEIKRIEYQANIAKQQGLAAGREMFGANSHQERGFIEQLETETKAQTSEVKEKYIETLFAIGGQCKTFSQEDFKSNTINSKNNKLNKLEESNKNKISDIKFGVKGTIVSKDIQVQKKDKNLCSKYTGTIYRTSDNMCACSNDKIGGSSRTKENKCKIEENKDKFKKEEHTEEYYSKRLQSIREKSK